MSELKPPIRPVVWQEDDLFVYVRCPDCGCSIPEGFSKLELVRFYPGGHKRGGRGGQDVPRCSARFVLLLDPMGLDHQLQELNHNTAYEDYVRQAYLEPKTMHRALSVVARIHKDARQAAVA